MKADCALESPPPRANPIFRRHQRGAIRCLALLTACAWSMHAQAQTTDEKKGAAQKWLAKDEIKIDYSGAVRATFAVDMKAKTTMFYGASARDACMRGPVPTRTEVADDGDLVFAFDFKVPGCLQAQYRFDPVSKAGVVLYKGSGASADTPWSTSPSKVQLLD